MQTKTRLYLLSIIVILFFVTSALLTKVYGYITDSIIIFIIMTLLYILYDKLNQNPLSYLIMLLALALHNAGVFGFYYKSPLGYFDPIWEQHISPHPFQWDHITHLFSGIALSLLFFSFFKKFFTEDKLHNFFIILSIFLIAQGIGAIGEIYEFAGYFFVGEGEGVTGRGAGDYSLYWISSDWINTMLDLVYNFLGALIGIGLCYLFYKKH